MSLRENLSLISPLLPLARSCYNVFGDGSFMRVLIYHDIPSDCLGIFRQQMEFISDRYRVVTPSAFAAMKDGTAPIAGGNVLVTFDDAFKSNRLVAENILEPLGIKALFFVPTDFMECSTRAMELTFITQNIHPGLITDDVSVGMTKMDWADLEYLLAHGHAIGSHTKSHARLSMIEDMDILKREIVESGDILEDRLGVSIDHFAYPFGNIDSISPKALSVAAKRYKYIFSGIRGNNRLNVSPATLRRDHVPLDDSLSYFHLILEGGLSPYYLDRRKRLDGMLDAYTC